MMRVRTLILGAAGRDFHDFNVVYRTDAATDVVAFTAAQIPGIAGRRYPASLAGSLYPQGIPILPESELESFCRRQCVQRVVLAYSDLSHAQVMHLASRALACGADFLMHGPRRTMLRPDRPAIAVCGVRTGVGKSQVSRAVADRLRARGVRVAVIRHPMPYGDLESARAQRFACLADLEAARCTIEEREEYEPHIARGNVVFSGVDTAQVLALAQHEADCLVWDGGNNDLPFVQPDLLIGVVDALRPEQVDTHHPGEAVVRMADVVVINKVNAAAPGAVRDAVGRVQAVNPGANIVHAASVVRIDRPELVRGRRVLVVEDGPTLTHGGMAYGAGYAAARAAGASQIVDPRASAVPALAEVFARYPRIGPVLPAMGYDEEQRNALVQTIRASAAETIVAGTPIDLGALLQLDQPVARASYELEDAGEPTLRAVVDDLVRTHRSLW